VYQVECCNFIWHLSNLEVLSVAQHVDLQKLLLVFLD
jgi:hypothetical protein